MKAVEAGSTLLQMELWVGVEGNLWQVVDLYMETKGSLLPKTNLLSESILMVNLQVGHVGIQELEVIYKEMQVGSLVERNYGVPL